MSHTIAEVVSQSIFIKDAGMVSEHAKDAVVVSENAKDAGVVSDHIKGAGVVSQSMSRVQVWHHRACQ